MITGIYSANGIGLEVKRVVKIELNSVVRFSDADKNWNYNKSRTRHREDGLIEHTEEIENFLNKMSTQMDLMCLKVLNFFNTDDLDELKLKMSVNSNLIDYK